MAHVISCGETFHLVPSEEARDFRAGLDYPPERCEYEPDFDKALRLAWGYAQAMPRSVLYVHAPKESGERPVKCPFDHGTLYSATYSMSLDFAEKHSLPMTR